MSRKSERQARDVYILINPAFTGFCKDRKDYHRDPKLGVSVGQLQGSQPLLANLYGLVGDCDQVERD